MKKVVIILYPGESSTTRIRNPANYSLPRLLMRLANSQYYTYIFNLSSKEETTGNLKFIPFTYFNLTKVVVKVWRYKVLVISQDGRFDRLAYSLKRLFGFKFMIRRGGVFYGNSFINGSSFRKHKKRRKFYQNADQILSTSDGTPVTNYFAALDIPTNKVVSLLNGFPKISNSNNYKRGNFITCISRLHKIKSIDYVLKSFAKAKTRLNDKYLLRIVGDGPERDNLRQLSKELGIDDDILFVGASHDAERWFYTSKLMLTGLSNNTVIESIVTSTAVICVDLGEMMTLYGHYPNVFIVPYNHGGYGRISSNEESNIIDETANKIVSILNNNAWKFSITVNEPELGWSNRIERELKIYEDLFK
jgi:glycosyltransferase involved in cell wall biosynthesis